MAPKEYSFKNSLSLLAYGLLTACSSIPSAGPSAREIVALNQQNSNAQVPVVELIKVSDAVSKSLYQAQTNQSLAQFRDGYASVGATNVGNMLDITVWEAPPAVLFGGALSSVGSGNAQQTKLSDQMVTSAGIISVPFIGDISVTGKTPVQVQNMIKGRLKKMASQPQIAMRLIQNNAATVSVIRTGNSVRISSTTAGERVLDAVAAVGGSTANVQDTDVQLIRGNQVKTVALEGLASHPRRNILLRHDDIITMITNPNNFTSMGAVGRTQQIGFSVRGLSLAEAAGRMRGLQNYRADARGIFVFHYTPVAELPSEKQGKWTAQGYGSEAEIPVVYRLNLSDTHSLFWMQRSLIRNKDVVYVSNVPLSEAQRFLFFVFSPVVNSTNSINNLTN